MTIKKLPNTKDADLVKASANICTGDVTHCIIVTMDEDDYVNTYSYGMDEETHDMILCAALGDAALETVLRYKDLDHLKCILTPEELE